jgi:hypothetical protein
MGNTDKHSKPQGRDETKRARKDSVEIQLLYSLTASQLQDGERAKTHRPGIGKVSKAEVKERSGVTHSNAGGAIGMQ